MQLSHVGWGRKLKAQTCAHGTDIFTGTKLFFTGYCVWIDAHWWSVNSTVTIEAQKSDICGRVPVKFVGMCLWITLSMLFLKNRVRWREGQSIKQWGGVICEIINRGILIPQLLHWINSSLIHELIRTHLIKTSDVFILLLVFWWKEEAVTAKCFLPSPKSNPSEGMNVFIVRTD